MKLSFPVIVLVFNNLIPLFGVMFWGWSIQSVLVLYWLETVIIGIINIPKIVATKGGFFTKLFIIPFFILHFGAFCSVHGFFLVEIFHAKPEFESLRTGGPLAIAAMFMFASHLFSLIFTFFRKHQYRGVAANEQMFSPYGRIIIMHIVVLVGAGFVQILGAPIFALFLLIALKMAMDWLTLRFTGFFTTPSKQ